jgi:hypothetical protein
VAATVSLSVLAHGASAVPWSKTYAKWFAKSTLDDAAMSESREVEHMPARKRIRLEADES